MFYFNYNVVFSNLTYKCCVFAPNGNFCWVAKIIHLFQIGGKNLYFLHQIGGKMIFLCCFFGNTSKKWHI